MCRHCEFRCYEYSVPSGQTTFVFSQIRVCVDCHQPEVWNEGTREWKTMKEIPCPK